tara:strand:- start:170 stop:562 length:393 start_codon:yes stop_codon:yes gene_type:complete
MFKFNGIDHLNITVKNLDKSVDYYQRIFGFEVLEAEDYNGTPYKIIGTSQKGMLCMYEDKDLEVKNNNIGHYGFNIEFTENIVEKLEEAKADVRYYNGQAIIQYPNSKSIYVHDPDGNQIELSENFAGGL